MRTRVRRPATSAVSEAASEFLADPTKADRIPGAKRAKAMKEIEVALAAAETRAKSGEWGDADARTLVGLYAWCHRSVYDVIPVELESITEFRIASRAALRVLHERFEDDAAAAAIFIRWSWKREKERADWCRANKRDRNRMGWRLQFSDRQVTDFRVAAAGRVAR